MKKRGISAALASATIALAGAFGQPVNSNQNFSMDVNLTYNPETELSAQDIVRYSSGNTAILSAMTTDMQREKINYGLGIEQAQINKTLGNVNSITSNDSFYEGAGINSSRAYFIGGAFHYLPEQNSGEIFGGTRVSDFLLDGIADSSGNLEGKVFKNIGSSYFGIGKEVPKIGDESLSVYYIGNIVYADIQKNTSRRDIRAGLRNVLGKLLDNEYLLSSNENLNVALIQSETRGMQTDYLLSLNYYGASIGDLKGFSLGFDRYLSGSSREGSRLSIRTGITGIPRTYIEIDLDHENYLNSPINNDKLTRNIESKF